jgi:dihydroorotate dehydrogenase electron transfer subunit
MTIETPTHYRVLAEVSDHQQVAPRYFRLKLRAPGIAGQARAGHFVHVMPRAQDARDPLLRRAFSILVVENEDIEILYRVEGRGTALMARWSIGDTIDVLGPLGNGFTALPAPPQRAILVGGGVGVPPMVMLASCRNDNQRVVALIGARSEAEVICREDFAKFSIPVRVATDDGSCGHHGLVTDLLEDELEQGGEAIVFSCGPLPMLRAVAKLCRQFKVPCQVSLEENMPCGVGVCNGCVVPVADAGDDYGRYRRICVEGPVLWAHEIDWERLGATHL